MSQALVIGENEEKKSAIIIFLHTWIRDTFACDAQNCSLENRRWRE